MCICVNCITKDNEIQRLRRYKAIVDNIIKIQEEAKNTMESYPIYDKLDKELDSIRKEKENGYNKREN